MKRDAVTGIMSGWCPNKKSHLILATTYQLPKKAMAKSTRSKTKRSFRRVKREDTIYAVTHAQRLERLSKKLAGIAQTDKTSTENDEDVIQDEAGLDMNEQGWPMFALLGLVDADGISAFGLEDGMRARKRRRLSRCREDDDLRALSAVMWQHLSESCSMERFA
jgi:hypothetical protein